MIFESPARSKSGAVAKLAGTAKREGGFSLIEVVIALSLTLATLGVATAMLTNIFNIRSRENTRTEALADTQRAINRMAREIANSGFGLTNNGIVSADSDGNSIRVRANLNAFSGPGDHTATSDSGEDIKYLMDNDSQNNYLVRYDVNTGRTTVLANRIDSISIKYYDRKVSYNSDSYDCNINVTLGGATDLTGAGDKSAAQYIIIVACVKLPEVGRPGSTGFQPASQVKLVTDVTLRNANLRSY